MPYLPNQPLQGYRVIDLTNVLAGPFCCQQLAHLGAEVIKVENPDGGDLARQLGGDEALSRADMGTSFLAQNIGKQSVALNLKNEPDRERFRRLIEGADAVVENFRPGVMRRLGLDFERLRPLNPGLVYCAISGFGQSGPLKDLRAYDQIIQGMSGLMSVTGDADSSPLRAGYPVADTVGGLTAAFAICSVLAAGPRQGDNKARGCLIDVSMLESMLSSMGWIMSNFLIAGHPPEPLGNDNATGAPSGTFRTGSGLINIAAAQQVNFEKLCGVIDAPSLPGDERFENRHSRLANRVALTEELERVLAGRTAAEWQALISAAGVPAGCVLEITDILEHPQVSQRELVAIWSGTPGLDRKVAACCPGFLINNQRPKAVTPPPTLGQHSDRYQ